MVKALQLLNELERLKTVYDGDTASRRLELLLQLGRRRLPEPEDIERFHECLCFARAYPDNRQVLNQVEAMLNGFAERSDVQRYRRYLDQTTIAGTSTQFPFFWSTACWLADRWPGNMEIDWEWWDEAKADRLVAEFLPLIMPYSETPALDMLDLSPREWLSRLKGEEEGDAAFLIRRFRKMDGDDFSRETMYDSLDVPVILHPGLGTPSRSTAHHAGSRVVFQEKPLQKRRPDLRKELHRPPNSVRRVPPREADRLIDLTREAMVNRLRDLYTFSYPDRNDVSMVDCGDGLQFVCIGTLNERRLMLESVYGFLTLKNGVPIGYVLASSLFGSTEIAYNVFETFRSGEAAKVFGRLIGMCRHLFGSESFSIDPYQLGYGNQEGLQSGAWWFYYKLGFRPRDPGVKKLVRRELAEMKKNPKHRTDLETLEQMASKYLFFDAGESDRPSLGELPLGNAGMAIGEYLAARFGSDREKGLRTCADEAAKLLGVRSWRTFPKGERLWWQRWSPLVLLLPGVKRWGTKSRRELVKVMRAKGGRSEMEFLRRFNRHKLLQKAMLKLITT